MHIAKFRTPKIPLKIWTA